MNLYDQILTAELIKFWCNAAWKLGILICLIVIAVKL